MLGVVGSSRYIPRKFTAEPDAFGRALILHWDTDESLENQIDASQIQHQWAYLIRQAVRHEYGSIRHYCEMADVDYHRLTSVLRGTAVMRLEDIASAQRTLDLQAPEDWLV